MKKMTKIVSLLLVVVTIFGLTACSNTPDYTVDEMLQKGMAMLDPSGETAREFTLTIAQGEKYNYTFNGRIANGALMSSLTVSRNGLKSNYKNLFLVHDGNLHVNLNGAMSASESEVGFTFTDSSALQGRYLTIPNGYNITKEWMTYLQTNCFAGLKNTRTEQETVKGNYHYNYKYSGAAAIDGILGAALNDTTSKTEEATKKYDEYIQAIVGDAGETFDTVMLYLNDCIDIDTEEIIGEYESLGQHTTSLLAQELTALKNLISIEGSYITEGIYYTTDRGETFQYTLTFCDASGAAYGKIDLLVKAAEVEAPNPDIYTYITMQDFLGTFLTNVKNVKGVGYETSDFPYTAVYTANRLTLTENNDLYKVTHVFDFSNGSVSKYTVTYYTYEMYMHNALKNKCESMNLQYVNSASDELSAGTGSGYLEYTSQGLGARYSASDPIELLELLKEIGVPTYGD